MVADWIQAIAAVATFLAAALAVWAAFRAPKMAARFAEDLRLKNQQEDEERRLKLWVFSTLMQNRRTIPNSHPALNLIDVVFRNSPEVRGAWRHFHSATMEPTEDTEKIVTRYLQIIEKIAADLGVGGNITVADIHTGYYPQALSQLDELQYLEAVERLQRLRGTGTPPQ